MPNAKTVPQGNESPLETMAVVSTRGFVGSPAPGHRSAQYRGWTQGSRQRVEMVMPLEAITAELEGQAGDVSSRGASPLHHDA